MRDWKIILRQQKEIISFELAKKIQLYLSNFETEYKVSDDWIIYSEEEIEEWLTQGIDYLFWAIKTLTFEEALNFLPRTNIWITRLDLIVDTEIFRLTMYTIDIANEKWAIDYISSVWTRLWIWQKTWRTQIEAVENMINYLLDNNLLIE